MDTLHELIEYAESLDTNDLNWDGLEGLYSDVDVEVRGLMGRACALATFHNKIYVDSSSIDEMGPELFYFVLLHEKGHLESIRKYGLDFHLAMISSKVYEDYFEHIITEEVTADRYAAFCYYQMNGVEYKGHTQELHLPEKQEEYHDVVDTGFGMVQNNIERYNQLIETMLE